MARLLKQSLLITGVIGVVLGVLLTLGAEQFDRLTTTEAFCADTCHSMQAYMAEDPVYRNSTHRTTASGIQAGCADCHVPKGLVPATWSHITDGTRDLLAELTRDYSSREAWEERRPSLAYGVRDKLLASDSATCRSCHQRAALKPVRERGQRQHELADRNGVSCIGCHFDLVHAPVKPRASFLDKVRVEGDD
ncbi:MAG: hypothetical protein BMS9Abin08_0594 [Gammaproteobacteria bacterium]|nr:MAG: hypothetical protein BMS9Abin08_0594 [Gammaproteobacteria bacterium]